MFSQPLSELVARFQGRSFQEFLLEYPHPWLVLEAGPRLAPLASERTMMLPRVGDAERMGAATAYPLSIDKPCNSVGRDVESDVCIADAALSRAHFVLFRAEGGWSIRDARSTNGTYLDGKKLAPIVAHNLREGAVLQAGQLKMHFYQPASMYQRLMADARKLNGLGDGDEESESSTRRSIENAARREDSRPHH
jgi:hypothetical protein